MNNHDDIRRDEARRRLAARRGDAQAPRGARTGGSASLSSLHRVSPQMRERYGVSGASAGTGAGRRAGRYGEWDDYDDVTWDDGRGSAPRDWASPSVDAIGGRSLAPGRGRGGGARGGMPGRSGGRFGGPFWIALAVTVLLLVVVVAVAASSCSVQESGEAAQDEQATQQEQAEGSEGQSEESSASEDGPDRAKLEKILDKDTADKLIARASTSDDAKWIAMHPEAYAGEGEAVQRKLLKLAADEPAAYSYVRNYPDKYPMDKPDSGQIQTIATGRGIPRLYQWDALWGYTKYSGTAFGLTGCAPTALSMVYQGLTGNTDLSPYDMGELAERDGYMTDDEGTMSSFLTDEASALGLSVSTIDVTEDALKKALESNQVVIVNFAPGGIFTETGHYAVITGRTQDGSLVLNDPYSEERSNKKWDYGTIVNEAMGFYAYG